jgi:hypothetical protein
MLVIPGRLTLRDWRWTEGNTSRSCRPGVVMEGHSERIGVVGGNESTTYCRRVGSCSGSIVVRCLVVQMQEGE